MTQVTRLKLHRDRIGNEEERSGDYLVMRSFKYRIPANQDYAQEGLSADSWVRGTRYCDQPMDWRTRLVGLGGTSTVCALILLAALFTWKRVEHINTTTADRLIVMELAPLAAPPEAVQEVAPGPEQVERQKEQPEPKPDMVVPPPRIALPVPSTMASERDEPVVNVVNPGPPISETTAPKSIVAPTATRVSNNVQSNWESQILAHLERFRRYPARARAARQQGMVLVRFTMNRAGMVLSASIAKKSGSFDLDQAALDTVRRAQPLPAIPADRADIVELTIPVEFYMRR